MASGSLKTLGAMATKNPFSMGHATRSFASEQLKDRHPYLEPPFRSGVDPREIADAFGNRRMTKLVEVLEAGKLEDPDEYAKALRYFIGNLSDQARKTEAIACGAPRVLTQLLSNPPEGSADCKRLSADALSSISLLLSGRRDMAAAAAPRAMTAALLDPSPAVRDSAAKLCESFTRSSDGTASALSDEGANFVPRLVECIEAEDSTTTVRASALRALGNVAGFAGGLSAVLSAGHACRAALHALEHCDPETDHALMESAARVLRQISAHPRGKVAVLEGGGLPALAALLTAPFESVRQMAVGAVLSVSTEFDAKLAVAEEAGAQLGAMTSDPTPGVALDAVRALQAAAELPAARKHLLKRLDPMTLALVFPDAAAAPARPGAHRGAHAHRAPAEDPPELPRRTYLNYPDGASEAVSDAVREVVPGAPAAAGGATSGFSAGLAGGVGGGAGGLGGVARMSGVGVLLGEPSEGSVGLRAEPSRAPPRGAGFEEEEDEAYA